MNLLKQIVKVEESFLLQLMVRILILFLDMVPNKILKKLKLTEEKSVATVVEADFKTITKSNNQIR